MDGSQLPLYEYPKRRAVRLLAIQRYASCACKKNPNRKCDRQLTLSFCLLSWCSRWISVQPAAEHGHLNIPEVPTGFDPGPGLVSSEQGYLTKSALMPVPEVEYECGLARE